MKSQNPLKPWNSIWENIWDWCEQANTLLYGSFYFYLWIFYCVFYHLKEWKYEVNAIVYTFMSTLITQLDWPVLVFNCHLLVFQLLPWIKKCIMKNLILHHKPSIVICKPKFTICFIAQSFTHVLLIWSYKSELILFLLNQILSCFCSVQFSFQKARQGEYNTRR